MVLAIYGNGPKTMTAYTMRRRISFVPSIPLKLQEAVDSSLLTLVFDTVVNHSLNSYASLNYSDASVRHGLI